jgi:hypothetical protein
MESAAVPQWSFTWHRCGGKTATQFQQLACCTMRYLAAFIGKAIHSAVQKMFGKFSCKLLRQKERVAAAAPAFMMGRT